MFQSLVWVDRRFDATFATCPAVTFGFQSLVWVDRRFDNGFHQGGHGWGGHGWGQGSTNHPGPQQFKQPPPTYLLVERVGPPRQIAHQTGFSWWL
jgi:hypothetical protein